MCTNTRLTISIHALLAESDTSLVVIGTNCVISIHALLAESDVATVGLNLVGQIFLSTLSLRRATTVFLLIYAHIVFLSTLSLRRATEYLQYLSVSAEISIHALLAESDNSLQIMPPGGLHFYPRSPCGERLEVMEIGVRGSIFLSTLSLRRATLII